MTLEQGVAELIAITFRHFADELRFQARGDIPLSAQIQNAAVITAAWLEEEKETWV